MLSIADASLIERDKAILGMKTVLDQEEFFNAVKTAKPELNITGVQLTYLRYRATRSCLGAYQIKLDNGLEPLQAHVTAFNSKAYNKLMYTNHHSINSHHIVLQDQILISLFPGDTQLIALKPLMNRERRQNIVNTLLPAHLETCQGKLETLAYKPERRYVGRLALKNGNSALLKHYRKHEYQKSVLATNIHTLTPEQLRIPRLLGSSQTYQILMFEWLPGTLLDTEIKINPDVRSLHASGAALAKFHTITTKGLTHRTLQMRAEKLTGMAKTIAHFYPSLGELSHDIALLIVQNLQHEPSAMQRIHGDFYPKQVILMAEGQVAIIDHDENIHGDPMEDLGLFIAHLLRNKRTKRIAHDQTELLIEALIEGYESFTQKTVTPKLYCYVAAALFSLTHSPFRNHKSNWPEETLITLELINDIMHSSNLTTSHP